MWRTINSAIAHGACLSLVLLAILAADHDRAPADEKAPESVDAAKAERAARLATMKTLAAQFEMKPAAGDNPRVLELRPEPIFRYSDQPRGFVDATLWAWAPPGSTGRPTLLSKVEAAVTLDKIPYWHFCVVSLADEPVTADFEGVRKLAAAKPGFELRRIPNAPEASDKPLIRQRHMKELVARFGATIFNTNPDTKKIEPQEMRLLASPIHRYAEESAGLWDGMIFGLTTNGTNPDMLVVIELRGTTAAAAQWQYGIVKMTIAEVRVRLDRDQAWSSPRNSPRETWDSFTKMPRDE